jgi:uncharacterized membrane protein YeaQ/YmgE (transglycosylase-associated protein family)
MVFLIFILFGLVVGMITRAVLPGKQGMGLVPTALFGLTGSFLAGLLGCVFYGERLFNLHGFGIIGSVLAALFVLLLVGVRARGRRRAVL